MTASHNEMSFREMNLRVFQGKPVPHVFFQPRFEPWYDWHRRFSALPADYIDMTVRDLYDYTGSSMRYIHYFTGIPDPVDTSLDDQVKTTMIIQGREAARVYHTPYGDLTEEMKKTIDEEWRTVEFAARSVADLKALRWLIEHTQNHFVPGNFQMGSAFVGHRGVPQFWVPKSPYMALAQSYMKLQHLIYALADAPEEVEATMKVIDDSYDDLYREIIGSGLVQIVNFGENLHDSLFSPRYVDRYLMPWYEKRAGQLREGGIFTYMHLDGYFHSMLKVLKDMPFDGIEALTPTPQGDVTLEEMRDHIGNKILLDGIPAVLFMDTYSRDDLMQCVEKIVEYFSPRLVLGVSDEVPEGAPQEAIERVKMVAEWCKVH